MIFLLFLFATLLAAVFADLDCENYVPNSDVDFFVGMGKQFNESIEPFIYKGESEEQYLGPFDVTLSDERLREYVDWMEEDGNLLRFIIEFPDTFCTILAITIKPIDSCTNLSYTFTIEIENRIPVLSEAAANFKAAAFKPSEVDEKSREVRIQLPDPFWIDPENIVDVKCNVSGYHSVRFSDDPEKKLIEGVGYDQETAELIVSFAPGYSEEFQRTYCGSTIGRFFFYGDDNCDSNEATVSIVIDKEEEEVPVNVLKNLTTPSLVRIGKPFTIFLEDSLEDLFDGIDEFTRYSISRYMKFEDDEGFYLQPIDYITYDISRNRIIGAIPLDFCGKVFDVALVAENSYTSKCIMTSEGFTLIPIEVLNDKPLINRPIEDKYFYAGEEFFIEIPHDTFIDKESNGIPGTARGMNYTLYIREKDGTKSVVFPSWLKFDAERGLIYGTPTQQLQITLVLEADDGCNTASIDFQIEIVQNKSNWKWNDSTSTGTVFVVFIAGIFVYIYYKWRVGSRTREFEVIPENEQV